MKQIIRRLGQPIAIIDSSFSVYKAWIEFKQTYGYPSNNLNFEEVNLAYKKLEADGIVGVTLEEMFLDWFDKKYGTVDRLYVVDLV